MTAEVKRKFTSKVQADARELGGLPGAGDRSHKHSRNLRKREARPPSGAMTRTMLKRAAKYRPIVINAATGPSAARILSLARRAGCLLYDLRTKLATVAVAVLAVLLAVHVIFGANGMIVYQKKKTEYRALQKDVEQIQQQNQVLSDQIKALKSDPAAIEKEAREQLHYARPGEIVYLAPGQPAPTPPPNAAARK